MCLPFDLFLCGLEVRVIVGKMFPINDEIEGVAGIIIIGWSVDGCSEIQASVYELYCNTLSVESFTIFHHIFLRPDHVHNL